MNNLCNILTEYDNEDEIFEYISNSFLEQMMTWDYFVDWDKAISNLNYYASEINILNSLVGKNDIEKEFKSLLRKNPTVVKVFPSLLALRRKEVNVLVDIDNMQYKHFDFAKNYLSDDEIDNLYNFFVETGLGQLIRNEKLTNLVDYLLGVEVGLDSNARKNRGGSLMEKVVEVPIANMCFENKWDYISQANKARIESKWNIPIEVDKSSRNIDFAVKAEKELFFIEANFYGGGGSKLKATATEYASMNRYWNDKNINFVWITDGNGWKSTLRPLREYFDRSGYLLNLTMLKNGLLEKIIKFEIGK